MMRRAPCTAATTRAAGVRTLVTPGQYNPVHTFKALATTSADGVLPSLSKDQFTKVIDNPGPLRVVYAKDYAEWYHRAYSERAKFQSEFKTRLHSNKAVDAGIDKHGNVQTFAPASAPAAKLGLQKQAAAQDAIDEAAVQHGRYDLFERQAQFPVVHLDRCKPHHIKELLEEHVFANEVSSDDVWRRALLYRALFKARRANYPTSFKYALDLVDDCTFSFAGGAPVVASTGENVPEDLIGGGAMKRYPSYAAAEFYEKAALRFHVENAVDAHVVLRCHTRPDADQVLITEPPSMLDEEIDAVHKPTVKAAGELPTEPLALPEFPPLSALTDEPANLALATILLFVEFNCHVTTNPFAKYKYAARAVLRPTPTENRDLERTRATSERISSARGMTMTNSRSAQIIDSRAREMLQLQDANRRNDADWFKGMSSGDNKYSRATGGKDLASDPHDPSMAPPAVYNPRLVRAEVRDITSRRVMRGLRDYQRARSEMTRDADVSRQEMAATAATATPSMQEPTAAKMRKPTPQHFLRRALSDRHIALALTLLRDRTHELPSEVIATLGVTRRESGDGAAATAPRTPHELYSRLRRRVEDYAGALYATALDYHVEEQRRVQLRSVDVTAALVDDAMRDALVVLGHLHSSTNSTAAAGALDTPIAALRDPYTPLAGRALDKLGFPTFARAEDHKRYVAGPAAQ